jgi:hypothetical protein
MALPFFREVDATKECQLVKLFILKRFHSEKDMRGEPPCGPPGARQRLAVPDRRSKRILGKADATMDKSDKNHGQNGAPPYARH